jgi:hypothetical protein
LVQVSCFAFIHWYGRKIYRLRFSALDAERPCVRTAKLSGMTVRSLFVKLSSTRRWTPLISRITELTCEEYQALPVHERAPEDLAFTELAKKEKWRRCPKASL